MMAQDVRPSERHQERDRDRDHNNFTGLATTVRLSSSSRVYVLDGALSCSSRCGSWPHPPFRMLLPINWPSASFTERASCVLLPLLPSLAN